MSCHQVSSTYKISLEQVHKSYKCHPREELLRQGLMEYGFLFLEVDRVFPIVLEIAPLVEVEVCGQVDLYSLVRTARYQVEILVMLQVHHSRQGGPLMMQHWRRRCKIY
jgi:hypothetical protein